MSSTKKLALSGILVAMSTALLYFSSLIPTAKLAVVAAAGLLPAVAVIHCGLWWAFGVYGASGILSLLLLPDKLTAIWYLLVFGHYGILKSLVERLDKRFLEWIFKLGVFAFCIGGMYFLFRDAFLGALPTQHIALLIGGLLVCFVLFDIAFSGLIAAYHQRIKPHIEK